MFIRCDMLGSSFTTCNMEGVPFIESDMTDSKLEGCNAIKAIFIRCNVTNLLLEDTDVCEAIFINCKDNEQPITKEWLKKHGALNSDKAIVQHASGTFSTHH